MRHNVFDHRLLELPDTHQFKVCFRDDTCEREVLSVISDDPPGQEFDLPFKKLSGKAFGQTMAVRVLTGSSSSGSRPGPRALLRVTSVRGELPFGCHINSPSPNTRYWAQYQLPTPGQKSAEVFWRGLPGTGPWSEGLSRGGPPPRQEDGRCFRCQASSAEMLRLRLTTRRAPPLATIPKRAPSFPG